MLVGWPVGGLPLGTLVKITGRQRPGMKIVVSLQPAPPRGSSPGVIPSMRKAVSNSHGLMSPGPGGGNKVVTVRVVRPHSPLTHAR